MNIEKVAAPTDGERNVTILGVATATPPNRLSQTDALVMAQRVCCTDERQSRLAAALYRKSGVRNRHTILPFNEAYRWVPESNMAESNQANHGPTTQERMALYQKHALPLALEASAAAIQRAGIGAEAITHVVTASCTGFTAPGVDSGLIQGLQCRPTTQRVNVGYMGCHGAINALRVAHGLAHADPHSRILVCAVELCSLHYCFHWNSERMLGNALFADGAGAVVLGADHELMPFSAPSKWRVADTGSYLFPETAEVMTWNIEDHGFAMSISSRLPGLIQENLSCWLTEWLADHQLTVHDVRSWAVHPGGPKILEAVEAALQIRPDQIQVSRDILSEYGNMSSATVLFILESLLQKDAKAPCVMLGFGPGLVTEVALLL